MKTLIKKCITVLLALMLAAGMPLSVISAASTLTVKLAGKAYYSYAFDVLELVNEERAKKGQKALVMDEEMLETAMKRAAETNIYFSHTRPDGSVCFEVFPQDLWAYGENIAAGQPTPEDVMDSWMNSQGHRENILSSDYNVIGIGCYQAGDVLYWVQVFGSKNSVKEAAANSYQDAKQKASVKAEDSLVSIQVSASKKSLSKGGRAKIQVTHANAGMPYGLVPLYNTQFTFSSSNKRVVSVDSKGNLKGLKKGTAVIKAVFKNNGKSAGKVKITVK